MNSKPEDYVCKSTLRNKYQLSESWISRLGPPDKCVPNPHYRQASEMQLYEVGRVEKFIAANKAEYDAWVKKRAKLAEAPLRKAEEVRRTRVEASRKATRRVKDWMKKVAVKIRPIPANIWDVAQNSYEDHYGLEFRGMGYNGLVAYLRHESTNYEELLQTLDELTQDDEGNNVVLGEIDTDWRGRPVYGTSKPKFVHRLRSKVNAEIERELKRKGIPITQHSDRTLDTAA